ncbi:MAG: hypothetical protein LBH43_20210, partial [Treponema sp.]|nr:hypothetical protein [Treponema sp.]
HGTNRAIKLQAKLTGDLQPMARGLNLSACIHYLYSVMILAAYKPGDKKLVFKISDLEKYLYRNQVGNNSDRADAILNEYARE